MKKAFLIAAAALALSPLAGAPAKADGPLLLPFFPTPLVPSQRPLAFGMTATEAATALQVPITYVSGHKGNEIFVAALPGQNTLFPRGDKVYLQFRGGRLTGWKGDWNIAWVGP
jgi:hypothetical protein